VNAGLEVEEAGLEVEERGLPLSLNSWPLSLCSTSRPAFHALRSSNFRIYDTFITISNYQKMV